MVRLVKLMHRAFDMLGYFARREWSFPCNNLFSLLDQMSPADQKTFYMDVRKVNWRNYIHDFYMGIRRYLLKEDDSNIPDARKRMKWSVIESLTTAANKFLLLFDVNCRVYRGYYTLQAVLVMPLVGLAYFPCRAILQLTCS